MKFLSSLIISACLLMAGCSGATSDATSDGSSGSVLTADSNAEISGDRIAGGGRDEGGASSSDSSARGESTLTPAPIQANNVALHPENTKIEFVGTHVGDPNPRTGGFEKFTGNIELDPVTKELKSVTVEIQTGSLWTEVGGNLTNHLNSEDFFDTREYPQAKFASTDIAASGAGQYTITGNLTLLATTKEIRFPATVNANDDGLTFSSSFTIDRTEFGMDQLQGRVQKEVSMSVVVGEKTQTRQAAGGRGGRRGGGGGPGGGGRGGGRGDPAAFFQRLDEDSDGKLAGEEIPDRMRENLDDIDTNGDGAVSLAEFQTGLRQFGGRGGGRGGRGGSGGRGQGRPQRPPAQ